MTKPITVAETTAFERFVSEEWDAADYLEFVSYIADNPTAGAVVPGTGGVRKVRWTRTGIGKRGGVRVVYYYHDDRHPLLLLHGYLKANQGDLTPDQKKRLARAIEIIKVQYRS